MKGVCHQQKITALKLTLGGTSYELEFRLESPKETDNNNEKQGEEDTLKKKRKLRERKIQVASNISQWESIVKWATTQTARPFQPFQKQPLDTNYYGCCEDEHDTSRFFASMAEIERFIRQNMGGTRCGGALKSLASLLGDAVVVANSAENDESTTHALAKTVESAALEVEAWSMTRLMLLHRRRTQQGKRQNRTTAAITSNWWENPSFFSGASAEVAVDNEDDTTHPTLADVLLFGSSSKHHGLLGSP